MSSDIKRLDLFITTIFFALAIFLPILSVVFCFLYLIFLKKSENNLKIILSILIANFIFLNLGKELKGDLISYLNLLSAFSISNISELFLNPQKFLDVAGSFRPTEAIGYSFYWFLANFFSSSKWFFEITTTAMIYIPLILGLNRISKFYNYKINYTYILFFSFMFIGINFIQTTHIVRQYIAASFFILSLSYFLSSRIFLFAFFAFISVSFHNSTAMIFLPLILLEFFKSYKIYLKNNVIWLFNFRTVIILAFCFVGSVLLFINNPSVILANNGDISNSALTLDFTLLSLVLLLKFKIFKNKFEFYIFYLFIILFSVTFIYLNFNFKILALRIYFFLEFLRPVIAICVFSHVIKRYKHKLILYQSFYILMISFFLLRLSMSPWDYYGLNGSELIFGNIFNFINFFAY